MSGLFAISRIASFNVSLRRGSAVAIALLAPSASFTLFGGGAIYGLTEHFFKGLGSTGREIRQALANSVKLFIVVHDLQRFNPAFKLVMAHEYGVRPAMPSDDKTALKPADFLYEVR